MTSLSISVVYTCKLDLSTTLSEVSACGVFDAFDGLIEPCGVGLDFGELLLIVSDGLAHGRDVGGGYDSDAFCYEKGLVCIVHNQFFICPQIQKNHPKVVFLKLYRIVKSGHSY